MEIVELRDLPEALLPQIASLPAQDGDPPMGIDQIRSARRAGLPFSPYYAVYAVEDGRILARVETSWFTFTGPEGPQTVAAVCDVLTRPTEGRRGCAGALLTDVHRRETEAGHEWSFLWTHRTWGAHRLYERMGYADVYSPPVALRVIPKRPRAERADPGNWTVARRTDATLLEEMLARATRGRLGFVPRPPGSYAARFRLGWRSPRNHRILRSGSEAIGVAHLAGANPSSLVVNEVVVTAPEHLGPMLDALEQEAAGRWLMLETTTFIPDAGPILRERGYAVYPASHRTMMARPLVGAPRGSLDPAEICRDPAFSNHRGDMF